MHSHGRFLQARSHLYMKNYKVVNTYHKVFCYLESVNTNWENLMIYVVNLTQWVSSGYCESWILSFPSSIKYSCCNAMQYSLLLHNIVLLYFSWADQRLQQFYNYYHRRGKIAGLNIHGLRAIEVFAEIFLRCLGHK